MSLDFLGVVRMRTGGHALGSTVTRETKPYHITEFCPMCISNTADTPPHTLHQCTHGDIAQARAAEGAQLQTHLRRQIKGWGNLYDSATTDGDKTVLLLQACSFEQSETVRRETSTKLTGWLHKIQSKHRTYSQWTKGQNLGTLGYYAPGKRGITSPDGTVQPPPLGR